MSSNNNNNFHNNNHNKNSIYQNIIINFLRIEKIKLLILL